MNEQKTDNKILSKGYNKGITLLALIITMVVHCDNSKKYSNNNGFLFSRI